jgi:transposase
VSYDEELIALRLLADRRDELAKHRVQTLNRLHRLLSQLIPGGATRPDDAAGQEAAFGAPQNRCGQDVTADGR